MTPEEKSLLERTYKLAEENNAILRSIRRSARLTAVMRWAYWAVIILLTFGAYYFIQPYMTALIGVVNPGQGGISNDINNAQSAANSLKDLLK